MKKRVPLIAGNWKMHKTEAEAISLVRILMQRSRFISGVDILICPPFTSLSQLHKLLVNSPIALGAQNISDQPSGAFTGEISASMAAEFCSHVILGHSERRAIFDEDDKRINKKVKAALQEGLIPILCVGEILAEREAGQAGAVISRQLNESLQGVHVPDPASIVIAYEPVWAIGTGRSASPEDISEMISGIIRPGLAVNWGEEFVQGIRVLYGGSVNPDNAGGYLKQREIDGALIGGASLSAEKFLDIIEKTQP
jgi:triosephosphate isomerase